MPLIRPQSYLLFSPTEPARETLIVPYKNAFPANFICFLSKREPIMNDSLFYFFIRDLLLPLILRKE